MKKTSKIRLWIEVIPASSFQADFARSALSAMGTSAALYLNSSHKNNKASWAIELK